MLKNKLNQALVISCLLSCLPLFAWADSLGGMANNLMTPVSVLSGFLNSACLLVGSFFVFAGIIKYMEHRRSPLMVTISTVVFLFIAGIVLMLLPLVYKWTEGGIPFWK